MGFFADLRERIPLIKFLVNAQKTAWYPALFAFLCIVGGIHDYRIYIPIMWILVSMHLFSVFFTDDNKVFLTPLCMLYFAIGCDTSSDEFYYSGGNMLSYMSDEALKQIIIIGIVGVGSFLIRLILDGSVLSALKKRRAFTFGIIAMDIAFMLNGIFTPIYEPVNLAYGALLAMGFTVVYFLVCGMLDRSSEPILYGCYVMLGTAYIAFIQIMTVVFKLNSEGRFIFVYGNTAIMNKPALTLGWGVSTVIAAVFMLGIPAAMYLAKNRRGSFFTYFSCVLFILGSVLINSRGAMIVGIGTFAICTLLSCIRGKNKMLIRIYAIICLVLFAAAVIYVHVNVIPIQKLFEFLRFDINSDSGRGALWKNGISDFKKAPIFGAGFNDGGYELADRKNNFYSNMYHCILIQIPAATGIVGCIAVLIHFVEFAGILFKKFSVDKLFLLLVPLMVLGMSLLDNFFFYLDIQILYGVFLALAEKKLEQYNTEERLC